jgi:hypothetical protein
MEFITSAFEHGTSRGESHEVLEILLRALVALDESYLRHHPRTVGLYESGLRYQREPRGYEQWLTIPKMLEQKHADCEDLAAYRVAWLRQRCGIPAWPCFKWRQKGNTLVYHIIVCRPDGVIEDPSRVLGMGWGEDWKAPLKFPHPHAISSATV